MKRKLKTKEVVNDVEVICPPAIVPETVTNHTSTETTLLLYKGRILNTIVKQQYSTHSVYSCEGRDYITLDDAIKHETDRLMSRIFDGSCL
jgi:hypothetical protein